jgi:EAL domain-containing protein (putative c-di-GMP-specific phosphodiesterase class I)
VIFEITETAAIENIDTALEFIEEIRALGCLFSLDDFGAGFSSFKYLRSLPVEFVKIDGSFIVNILQDSANEATVRAIHQIAQGFGKMTVAEYVEDESVVDLLKEIGIDYAQGFHWGKPTAEPQLELTHAETAQPESTGSKNNKSARKTTKV